MSVFFSMVSFGCGRVCVITAATIRIFVQWRSPVMRAGFNNKHLIAGKVTVLILEHPTLVFDVNTEVTVVWIVFVIFNWNSCTFVD